MDWDAFWLSIQLALWTVALLLPVSVFLGRLLAYRRFAGKSAVEALVMLPLVLPPTVLGFYLLVALGAESPLGRGWEAIGIQFRGACGGVCPVQPALCHPARPARVRGGPNGHP